MKVNGKDYPRYYGKQKMFETTNQLMMNLWMVNWLFPNVHIILWSSAKKYEEILHQLVTIGIPMPMKYCKSSDSTISRPQYVSIYLYIYLFVFKCLYLY